MGEPLEMVVEEEDQEENQEKGQDEGQDDRQEEARREEEEGCAESNGRARSRTSAAPKRDAMKASAVDVRRTASRPMELWGEPPFVVLRWCALRFVRHARTEERRGRG